MSSNNCVKSMNIIVSFENFQSEFPEVFTFDDVINEFFEDNANAIEDRPHEDVVEEAVPDVNEEESDETGEDFHRQR